MTQSKMDHLSTEIHQKERRQLVGMSESRGRDWRHCTHQTIQNGIDAGRSRRRYKTDTTRPNSVIL
jgi:hypothetical protein